MTTYIIIHDRCLEGFKRYEWEKSRLVFGCYSNILLFVFIALFNDVLKFYTEETKRSYVECFSRKEGGGIACLLVGYGG